MQYLHTSLSWSSSVLQGMYVPCSRAWCGGWRAHSVFCSHLPLWFPPPTILDLNCWASRHKTAAAYNSPLRAPATWSTRGRKLERGTTESFRWHTSHKTQRERVSAWGRQRILRVWDYWENAAVKPSLGPVSQCVGLLVSLWVICFGMSNKVTKMN